MSLLVVSYPELARRDADWIAAIRQRHNFLKYSVLAPHITLVFPLSGVGQDDLLEHVRLRLTGRPRIRFAFRSSLLMKDDSSDDYYVVLVPDEGFSGIVKLHDNLYTGILAPRLRLDLPFIPHMTVGFSSDVAACKSLVDALNAEAFVIEGELAYLDVVNRAEARTVARFELG